MVQPPRFFRPGTLLWVPVRVVEFKVWVHVNLVPRHHHATTKPLVTADLSSIEPADGRGEMLLVPL